MNSKQRRTLAAVFADPASGNIAWTDIEGLLVAAGARVVEGRGSRVRYERDGEVETFHRPHPAKEAKRYQVRAARQFLERIGVKP
ncbi:MAG: type II toxin-antitoxin system HicA family toxin [Gammaproteobacteria bacterium]|nr:type II toxin-antitoxin system HicA family toxin [Gammaproteobacteria bacterium]MXY56316.1 type II toxin-antitoxin system HicA family toxin [Gammaproteobacteria bacterium]MYF28000.1 type II toxin-antitoxin system HicA family toxin [Gammaproteobacteria bacterium]MYK47889.1 type II toxin-antitoxin system HicA family toxin [Gammaproteobacteria bacterium]